MVMSPQARSRSWAVGCCLVLAAACLPGCERLALVLENRVEVGVELPARPQAWARMGPLGYRIIVPPSGGDPGMTVELPPIGDRAAARPAGFDLAPEGSAAAARLIIPKRMNLPLLAYPIPGGCERTDLLRPAGAVFPYSLAPDGCLVFRFEDGFLADLLTAVCGQGELLSAVNVPRLRDEIFEKAASDPWILDRGAILETLVYATMRSSRIRLLEHHSFDVPAREGEWVWGNPLRKGVTTSEGVLPIVELPVGTHVLFHAAGGSNIEDRILLRLDERGWQWLDVLTGSAGSGRW